MIRREPTEGELIIARRVLKHRLSMPGGGKDDKMTQQELADLVGCDRSKISQIETGVRAVTDEDAIKFAKIFHTNPSLLKLQKEYPPEVMQVLENVYKLADNSPTTTHSLHSINAIAESEIKKQDL